MCVVSSWVTRVYTILVWNTISGSSNLDTYFYYCLILTLIFHIKIIINFFLFLFFIIIISITITTTTIISIIITITITIIVIIVVVVLFFFIIYTINLPVVRSRSFRVIYYFDTPTLGIRHQSFSRVNHPKKKKSTSSQHNKLYFLKFCGHNICVLIYRQILSIFVSNSIFLNFNI